MIQNLFSVAPMGENDDLIPVFAEGDEQNLRKVSIPAQLPVLPLRNSVLFPGVVMPININREKSVRLVRDAFTADRSVATVMQKDAKLDDPTFGDLHRVGTAARILRLLEMPDGTTTVILQGTRRITLEAVVAEKPYFTARVNVLEDILPATPNEPYELLIGSIRDVAMNIIRLSPHLAPEAAFAVKNIDSKLFLINYLAANTEVSGDDKQKLLEVDGIEQRAQGLLELLMREKQTLELKSEIQQKVHKDLNE